MTNKTSHEIKMQQSVANNAASEAFQVEEKLLLLLNVIENKRLINHADSLYDKKIFDKKIGSCCG